MDERQVLFRQASLIDLNEVATWIHSRRDCELWAGPKLSYPIELNRLPDDIEFNIADSIIMHDYEKLLAFGQLITRDTAKCLIARLIVVPAYRRRGHGSRLVKELLRRARDRGYRLVSLNVDRHNLAAQALYSRFGFTFSERPAHEFASSQSEYMVCELT